MLIKALNQLTREWEEAEGRVERLFPTGWKTLKGLRSKNKANIDRDKKKKKKEETGVSHRTHPSRVD